MNFAGKETFKSYTFDRVFGEDASQQEVYLEISHLIECAIFGEKVLVFLELNLAFSSYIEIFIKFYLIQFIQIRNSIWQVCIFCYGQSGSGKTFTMEGGSIHNLHGIIPHRIDRLYSAIEKAELEGKEVEFTLEVLQVINNTTENIGESSSKKCDKKGMRKFLNTAKSRRFTVQ